MSKELNVSFLRLQRLVSGGSLLWQQIRNSCEQLQATALELETHGITKRIASLPNKY